MNESFTAKICKEYNNNLAWNKIKQVLKVNFLLKPNLAELFFEFRFPQLDLISIIHLLVIFYKDKFLAQYHFYIL